MPEKLPGTCWAQCSRPLEISHLARGGATPDPGDGAAACQAQVITAPAGLAGEMGEPPHASGPGPRVSH